MALAAAPAFAQIEDSGERNKTFVEARGNVEARAAAARRSAAAHGGRPRRFVGRLVPGADREGQCLERRARRAASSRIRFRSSREVAAKIKAMTRAEL